MVAGRNTAQAHLRLHGLVSVTRPSGTGDPNLAVAAYALLGGHCPLRGQGLRIAADDAGAEFASVRHILRLHPDIIKTGASSPVSTKTPANAPRRGRGRIRSTDQRHSSSPKSWKARLSRQP
ncbi:EAL domain-containing protein [Arthrobacter sp. KBS0703]|nr:EAL domain-containing protein [Arthrobacter sp. KBS0703]